MHARPTMPPVHSLFALEGPACEREPALFLDYS
jgi:hypothetical protein